MLHPDCLKRGKSPSYIYKIEKIKNVVSFSFSENLYIAKAQNYDCAWELSLSPKAYEAYKRGDEVFDSYWGSINPFWEKEVRTLSMDIYDMDVVR